MCVFTCCVIQKPQQWGGLDFCATKEEEKEEDDISISSGFKISDFCFRSRRIPLGSPVQLLPAIRGKAPLHLRGGEQNHATVPAEGYVPRRGQPGQLLGLQHYLHNVRFDYDEQRAQPRSGLNSFLDGSRITFVKKVHLTNLTFGVP